MARNIQKSLTDPYPSFSDEITFIVVKDGKTVYSAGGRGVKPIIDLYENSPELLDGAEVYDKIIGKAAAAILILGKAKFVYGEVMSAAAKELLKSRGTECGYGIEVDSITDRSGRGICPMERAVEGIEDLNEAYMKLKRKAEELAASGGFRPIT